MPEPKPSEKQDDFIQRCIPIVIEDGTAKDPKQGYAVCLSMWEQAQESKATAFSTVRPVRYQVLSETFLQPATDTGTDFKGVEWDVTIIGPSTPDHLVTIDGDEYVRSDNGRLYSVEALRKSVQAWNGVKVYDNHLTDDEYFQKGGMRSPKSEWLGTLVQPFWDAAGYKIKAIFKVVEDTLAKKLKSAWEQGVLNSIGLSIDTFPIVHREISWEGIVMPVIDGFEKILSVDLVGDPAAGGSLDRLLASKVINKNKEATMPEMTDEQIRELIKSEVGDIPAAVAAAVRDALAAQAAATEATETETEETVAEIQEPTETEEPEDVAALALAEARAIKCELMLERSLGKAKLPAAMESIIRDQYAGKVFQEADLAKSISQFKTAAAAMDTTGRAKEGASVRGLSVGSNERDKAEVEFLRLLAGNMTFKGFEHATDEIVTERISEAYKSWINDGRPNYGTRRLSEWVYNLLGGDPFSSARAYESVTTSGMASIVKNALNLLLANDYAVRERWWEPIVRVEEVDTIDQATLVRVYGMDGLDVVEEGGAYTELNWSDDEETAAFVKKGNYVGVTLEAMLRDKLNSLRSIPIRLSNSWYNTLSDLNAAVFTTNTAAGPVLTDTGALFNATAVTTVGGHANLLTTALGTTTAAYAAARLAMRKQTDQALGVGRRLGIMPKYLLVPYDLEVAAKVLMNTIEDPGQANYQVNEFAGESEVIAVPQWTDATDWALVADPIQHPAIWNIFLRGQRAPQLFTSDQETAGAMFTNDTLRYKIRMMTWRYSATYDCAPVSDFRPLHKSNVA